MLSGPHTSGTTSDILATALAHPRFEVVPIRGVEGSAAYLPSHATVPITSSPARGNESTLRVAELLAKHDLRVVPHIAARLVADESHLGDILARLRDLGIRDIFVIGGDAKTPSGKFSSALDLLRAVAEMGHSFERVGVAGYPEGHPLLDERTLVKSLRDKQAFASYLVTQITFDAAAIGSWLDRIRTEGIELPAYIGFAGVVDTVKLLRISMRIGVGDSLRFLRKRSHLVTGLFRHSGHEPTQLVRDLAPYLADSRYNVRGLHINTFNEIVATEEWRRRLLSKITAERREQASSNGLRE